MAELARGNVIDRPWGRTFATLGLRGVTGQLTLAADGKHFLVAFEDGAVVAASSPLASDAAVRVALTGHLVSSSQVPEISRRLAEAPDRDEIEVIAEMARLGPDHALRLRRRVIAQRAARTFSINHGEFSVTDFIELPILPGCELDVRAVVYMGARTNLSEQRLVSELDQLGAWFQLRSDVDEDLPQFGFSDLEQPVIERLRDGGTIPEIEAFASSFVDARTVHAVVYALASYSACDVRPAPASSPTAQPPRATQPPPIAAEPARTTTQPLPRAPTRPAPAEPSSATRPTPEGSRSSRPTSSPGHTIPPISTPTPAAAPTPARITGPLRRPPTSPGASVPRTNTPPTPTTLRANPPPPATPRVNTGLTTPRAPTPPGRSVAAGSEPPLPASESGVASGDGLDPPTERDGVVAPPETSRLRDDASGELPAMSRAARDSARSSPGLRLPVDATPGEAPTTGRGTRDSARSSPGLRLPIDATPGELPAMGRATRDSTRSSPALRPPPDDAGPELVIRRLPASRPPPARQVARADSPHSHDVKMLIAQRLKLLDQGADHFQLLGVSPDAPAETLRKAYFVLARQLHPDRLAALGISDEGKHAQRLFAQINAGFAILSNPARRAEYVDVLRRGGEAVVRAEQARAEDLARRVLEAEEAFRRGELAIRRDQPSAAVAELELAIQLNPDEADYHALLAWAQFCSAPDKMAIASRTRGLLDKAIQRSPRSVTARFYLGRVERMLGSDRDALRHFRDVLAAAPGHAEAAAEIRVIEARLLTGDKPGGGAFGRTKR